MPVINAYVVDYYKSIIMDLDPVQEKKSDLEGEFFIYIKHWKFNLYLSVGTS